MNKKPTKVVLAYSGGLDTSIILKWLQQTYDCPVVAFMADVGQGEELEPARKKAEALGATAIEVKDLRDTFVADYVWPMLRANALYEGEYQLGTSIARPLIASAQVQAAIAHQADALAHGATGKGNDQVRFELAYYAQAPLMQVIAPWRIWDLTSRSKMLEFAKKNGIEVAARVDGTPQYSMDANLLHISYEGAELEDPARSPNDAMWLRTVDPAHAPDAGCELELEFGAGDAVAIDGQKLTPVELLTKLNQLAGAHGVGRADIVESRFVGMKSRGCYETPGGTVLLKARRALESITLDREVLRIREDLMPRYATAVYNGFWFSPERELLQHLFDESARQVSGKIRLKLAKGIITILSRTSDNSLYDEKLATFEDDEGTYDQSDAGGFIKLNAMRLRLHKLRNKK